MTSVTPFFLIGIPASRVIWEGLILVIDGDNFVFLMHHQTEPGSQSRDLASKLLRPVHSSRYLRPILSLRVFSPCTIVSAIITIKGGKSLKLASVNPYYQSLAKKVKFGVCKSNLSYGTCHFSQNPLNVKIQFSYNSFSFSYSLFLTIKHSMFICCEF